MSNVLYETSDGRVLPTTIGPGGRLFLVDENIDDVGVRRLGSTEPFRQYNPITKKWPVWIPPPLP